MISLFHHILLFVISNLLISVSAGPRPKHFWDNNAFRRRTSALAQHDSLPRVVADQNFNSPLVDAPKNNVWAGLTNAEAASVTQWLFEQKELNLTEGQNGIWTNNLLLVELMLPNKTDALAYIDGNSSAPTRYAHCVLDMYASDSPTYNDILVGPLPVRNGTTVWTPLEYPYTRKTRGSVRNLEADYGLVGSFVYNISASVANITQYLYNGTVNDRLAVTWSDPLGQEGSNITTWVSFFNQPNDMFDASTLLPLGLYFQVDITGRDPSKWALNGWLYDNIFYPTTTDFYHAFESGMVKKLGANVEGDWARTDRSGLPFPMDDKAPPFMIAPNGSRFAVDREDQYVEWMDFSFYIGFTSARGLSLYDIQYKGQRIIYELGMEEALAHYAGNDPYQSSTAYFDSFYGFGPNAFEMVPGFDCPTYATYLNSSYYIAETTHTHINSICLFEYDAAYPIERHSTYNYVANTKNIFFTVRSVSTVGNYDYMFSYEFYLDGSIRVEVRASGYIQAAYYAHNGDYGYHIHDALSGSMHDHVLNFKADFDIYGTANTMELVSNVPATETYAWSSTPRNTMKLNRTRLASEDESRLFWAGNEATQYNIINTAHPNQFGESPGYRILPSSGGTAHLTVLNSSLTGEAARWAEFDVAVTRQHDTEPRAAHPYNNQDLAHPPVDFAAFFDGEPLAQQDLVLWFNLGMHHVPHTGDLPNTVFTTAHSSVTFMPVNYFADGDQSRRSRGMVRLDYGSNGTAEVVKFGRQPPTGTVDLDAVVSEEAEALRAYRGDVVVRKLPFDPNNPYYGGLPNGTGI